MIYISALNWDLSSSLKFAPHPLAPSARELSAKLTEGADVGQRKQKM